MLTRKSLKPRPERLATMRLGGSPTRVAVPPMLDASASAMRKGTGRTPICSHTRSVTGAISSTVVTLSRAAEATAVMRHRRTITRKGRPPARLAAQIAMYSKIPV